MNILTEKEFEDILVIHPELIEDNLTLMERQGQLENRRTDLIFTDKGNNLLLIELKKDVITRENIDQILDYKDRLTSKLNKKLRAMLIGQFVPYELREICKDKGIEWKEISIEGIFNYLQERDIKLYQSIFLEGKLHKKAKQVSKITFQEYLNVTSPFGTPYTSYQFFAPKDASPKLSDDAEANQQVADRFMNIIKNHKFDRYLFNNNVHLKKLEKKLPEWSVKAKGSWQGYVVCYELTVRNNKNPIPCEIYLGTIGYRGNKSTFLDEKSRFLVTRIGKGIKQVTTQYGFHKYLDTAGKCLLPFYELKFNAIGLPKKYWNEVYRILNAYGYFVRDSDDNKPTKNLWIGNISLMGETEKEVGNLIEALFSVTLLKAHFKGNEKGYEFDFLND